MVRPQVIAAVLALIALVPAVLYQLRLGTVFLALSVVSVVVLAGSFWTMFSPAEQGHA